MSGYSDLRKGRVSQPGQIYLVTFATMDRRPLFASPERAMVACQAMTAARLWYRSRLLCWVLMPGHWHGVIELGALDGLSTLVQRLKCNSARAVRSSHPDTGHVWEKGFHDRALRDATAVLATARYVVANPLRAGLSRRVGEYAWWDAVWLCG
ncbi:REP element-mobilizing transposase RayT [Pseudoxanthomonas japonensis]|uniref:REP-associated tyrosine transposase n=1 Tax=Pseudoxanthomonas japonensis TaxID=69284 RepID=UPI00285F2F8E|nr:transposase [Pseudoxanthomonas japonensis]MDR7070033.1 REP element-mobilizing transposase RayT [Pseudoxanthomonas japonensis]